MDTTYYSLSARHLKVSGGADLLSVSCAPVAAAADRPGQILDFETCRHRLGAQAQAEEPEEPAERPAVKPRSGRAERRAGLSWALEVCATVCVILASISAVVMFLHA